MFLQASTTTTPTPVRDYPEWHRGRSHFGLWYLELRQPALLSYLQQLRQHFTDFLLTPNIRQFHISLFICGFLTECSPQWDDDFTDKQLLRHIEELKTSHWPKLQLATGKINSFQSALFVEIQDDAGVLRKLRQRLANLTREIAPLHYCPHITLGLYKEAVPAELIFRRMREIKQHSFDFSVNDLTFGFYDAQVLQGPLYPHTLFRLGESCCN